MVQLVGTCRSTGIPNVSRDQSILVHQEVKVPKRLAASSTDVFVGKVNRESASR